MIFPQKKIYANVKRKAKQSFQLETICVSCKCRGKLWFNPKYKIDRHRCPKCHRKSLKSPLWINKPVRKTQPTY